MSHYSKAFTGSVFFDTCDKIACEMQETFERIGQNAYPILCYTGFSGITSATMLGYMLEKRGMIVHHIYVRKPNEESHGDPLEISEAGCFQSNGVPVFVDDFVDEGYTVNYVLNAIKEYYSHLINLDFGVSRPLDILLGKDLYTFDEDVVIVPHVLTGTSTDNSDTYTVDLFPEDWDFMLDNFA